MSMLLAFDVEIWCDGWSDLDRKVPRVFASHGYGRSAQGEYA